MIHGFPAPNTSTGIKDPLHLNDIEPLLSDGRHWKKGDLFISLRNRSTVLLYRPLTNKIMRTIQGSFYGQHDVDVISDSTISIFNNNVSGLSIDNGLKLNKQNKW